MIKIVEVNLIRGEEIILKSDSDEAKLFVNMQGRIVSAWQDFKGLKKNINPLEDINIKR